ncbi:hypothetical protein [Burkholderia thailandensis]|uniref:hypothetical protein n=1 Tax=Burkholderia thailandensis TaxID=57975 RepID=UPI00016A5BE6|nr:hypothetical protein [Burkholderia thailandensis]AVR29476.1 hypothetical protein A8H32_22865 [Burkholderia thailandensis]MDD1481962.1 hypothetical protein [Burkholderia thailandensis]MDD1488635.1 hypothetical protein [Burkholderia thailandensis]MDD1494903.1 hypothetical protein [Burkholderia thailandensis]PJO71588.1 hypothetical protein CWD92_14835 [Burkholderia thailandensis]
MIARIRHAVAPWHSGCDSSRRHATSRAAPIANRLSVKKLAGNMLSISFLRPPIIKRIFPLSFLP